MSDKLYTLKLTEEQWLKVLYAVNATSATAYQIGAETQSQALDDICIALNDQLDELTADAC